MTGRYATDPTYGDKLNSLISTYNLTRFDTPSTGAVSSTTTTTTTTTTSSTTQSSYDESAQSTGTGQTYTVVSGDSLWGIAQKFGMTIDDLMAKNGLSDYSLMVGQELTV